MMWVTRLLLDLDQPNGARSGDPDLRRGRLATRLGDQVPQGQADTPVR